MRLFKRAAIGMLFATLTAACSGPPAKPVTAPLTERPTETPAPTNTAEITIPLEISTPTETITSTPTLAATPTAAPTVAPTPTAPKAVGSPISAIAPQPTAAQICDTLAERGQAGLYALYVEPLPELTWDQTPRQFRVGLCNSLSVPLVPESHFVVMVRLPERRDGGGQTTEVVSQFGPGLHELVLGPWTPGLENHVTICAQKPVVEVIVGYSDEYRGKAFRPLAFPDGSNKLLIPVRCGGDYA